MPKISPSDNDCPRCGGEVKRVHRSTQETQTLSGSGLRRYRCEADACGWQGLLARQANRTQSRSSQSQSQTPSPSPLSERWRLWAVAVVVLVLLGLVSAGVTLLALRPDAGNHDGQPVKSL